MSINLIYWNPMSGSYLLYGCIFFKCGNFGKNSCFSGRIWPDWANTAWADMVGLGSIGLSLYSTATQKHLHWVLALAETPNAKFCIGNNNMLVNAKFCVIPNANFSRWPCTFHFVCVDFIRVA